MFLLRYVALQYFALMCKPPKTFGTLNIVFIQSDYKRKPYQTTYDRIMNDENIFALRNHVFLFPIYQIFKQEVI